MENSLGGIENHEYNTFLTMMEVGVSKNLFDEHFTVIWANDYYYKMTGYSKEEYEALYHNHVDEYYADDPELLAEIAQYVLGAYERKEPTYSFECKMHVKGGKYTWMWALGRFTEETYNGYPVIYCAFTNIALQKEMQFKLEQRSEMLREALEMAECANRAKSDFLSRMSHDIRTPMNAIVGLTNIAYSYLDNPWKMQDCLKKISLSSQHLLGLINDVLDMSKIESGKMVLNKDDLSLPDLLKDTLTIIQPTIKGKRQHFSIRLNNVRHEHFYSDALRLRQVFINILSNAMKFTPEEGRITVDVEELDSDRPGIAWLRFTFTDTGIGMQPEFIEHIFDAFTREKDSRVDRVEGTGLGMAISKKIVEMLEGDIKVVSSPGEGSSFIITLPLQINEVFETSVEDTEFPDLNLLVVDDDEIMCEYTVRMLAKMGVRSDWTTNSTDALVKIKEAYRSGREYHAVIIDWQMPGTDGIQTTRLIREWTRKDLPVVVISAYDWSDIEEEALKAGINGFLPKPIFYSTLRTGIQRYVLKRLPYGDRADRQESYDFSGKRFLLAEDNELNKEIAVELLSSLGATIDHAWNGAEAVRMFEQSEAYFYDLILMDIQMPGMNGYEATLRIRASERKDAADIPILAMTADAFSEDIEAAKKAGMDAHLAKPLDVSAMNREIAKWLYRNSG